MKRVLLPEGSIVFFPQRVDYRVDMGIDFFVDKGMVGAELQCEPYALVTLIHMFTFVYVEDVDVFQEGSSLTFDCVQEIAGRSAVRHYDGNISVNARKTRYGLVPALPGR